MAQGHAAGQAPAGLQVRVGGEVRRLSPDREARVGRGSDCAVRVHDRRVSRSHAVLRHTPDGWEIADQGSTGGTWVEGRRIDRLTLSRATEVRLGDAVDGPALHLEVTPADGPAPVEADAPATGEAVRGDPGRQVQPSGVFSAAHTPGERTRIGREADNDIVVDDILVSRHHAELRRGDDGVELVDLDSSNGTFVNGWRVQRAALAERDLVAMGRSLFRLVTGRLEEYRDTGAVTFAASHLTVATDGQVLVDDVSFALTERSLLGVVGPSGSGKSSLLGALAGLSPASAGTVSYAGRDLYEAYPELRNRIGVVPQQDVLHGELPVRHALDYAGRLRFPADVTPGERAGRIDEVLAELDLAHRADMPVNRLSGGERKRTSVALELLTKPSLLLLDEPAAGLDPGLARTLMTLLRDLADAGHTVIVVTHEIASLGLCDQVLMLAPGGAPAYVGPPQGATAHFGRAELVEVFSDLAAGAAPARPRREDARPAAAPTRPPPSLGPSPPQQGWWSQLATLTARYVEVLAADRRNLALLLAQAPVLGVLMLAALPPGELAAPAATEVRLVSTAGLVLFVLLVGATWLGANNAVREIARELPVLRRERAIGVSLSAYVTSKALVLGGLTVLQALVLVALAIARQDGPTSGVVLGWGPGELVVVVALAGVAAMALGLLVSAVAGSPVRATSVLPVLLILQLVLSAGPVLPGVVDQPVLRELSYAASAQWGVAAAAATVDLNGLQQFDDRLRDLRTIDATDPTPALRALTGPAQPESRWAPTLSAWLTSMGALLALTVVPLVGAALALRRFDPGR